MCSPRRVRCLVGGLAPAVHSLKHIAPPCLKLSKRSSFHSGIACWCQMLQIYHAEGIKGFYRGCVTNLLRTTPAAALTFTSFELISRHMKVLLGDQ